MSSVCSSIFIHVESLPNSALHTLEMNLDTHLADAQCNCFGQADAFLNTFLDCGVVVPHTRIQQGAIKVTLWTDLGSKIAGHSFVCVLDKGVIRICQAFYDTKSPFKHTHTLTKLQTKRLMLALRTKRITALKKFVPNMFEATDKIEVDIECITTRTP